MATDKNRKPYYPGKALRLRTGSVHTLCLTNDEEHWEIEELSIDSTEDVADEGIPPEETDSSTEEEDWEIEEMSVEAGEAEPSEQ